MEQKLSDTLVKAIDRSNPFMQNLQLASRFNKLVEQGGGSANLEDNKEIEITENGTVEITPTEGKDGMKKVTANVNVTKTLYKYSYTLDAVAVDSVFFKEEPQVGVPIEGFYTLRTSYDGENCTELKSDYFTFSSEMQLSATPIDYPWSTFFFKETVSI